MAYGGNNSYNRAIQYGSADYCYVIKEALLWAGWTLMASSKGAGSYSTSVDQVPTALDWNNSGAWCQLREPANGANPRRQYVFMRGSTATSMIIKYSRQTGFISGGAAAVLPTTGVGGDGVVWVAGSNIGFGSESSITLPTQGIASSLAAGTGYVSCIASDTPTNGVFGFWLVAYPYGGSSISGVMLSEGMSSSSTPVQDADPSVRQFANGDWYSTNTNVALQFWQAYGTSQALYVISSTYWMGYVAINAAGTGNNGMSVPSQTNTSLNVYDNKINVYPPLVTPAVANGPAGSTPKGFATGVGLFNNISNLLDTFNLTSAEPRLVVGGRVCVPWISSPPNVLPLV